MLPRPWKWIPGIIRMANQHRVVGCSTLNSGLFEALVKSKSMTATFCGHDHYRSFPPCPLYKKIDCNTLQRTATQCNNTLQHTATHCLHALLAYAWCAAIRCNTLQYVQHAAIRCNNPLRHIATRYSTLHRTATHCNTLQHTATHCNTLQHTASMPSAHPHWRTHSPFAVSTATCLPLSVMYIYVCMYIYIHMYIYTYICIYIHTCTRIRIQICIRMCVYECA